MGFIWLRADVARILRPSAKRIVSSTARSCEAARSKRVAVRKPEGRHQVLGALVGHGRKCMTASTATGVPLP
jgi:hypothetical protein